MSSMFTAQVSSKRHTAPTGMSCHERLVHNRRVDEQVRPHHLPAAARRGVSPRWPLVPPVLPRAHPHLLSSRHRQAQSLWGQIQTRATHHALRVVPTSTATAASSSLRLLAPYHGRIRTPVNANGNSIKACTFAAVLLS